MTFVAGQNLLPIAVALLIGFVTGLWIWKFARRSRPATRILSDDEPLRRPYVDTQPAPAPAPVPPFSGPRPEPEVLARRANAAHARGDAFEMPEPSGSGDELQSMKGVGPRLAMLLRAEGLTRFEQIAALGPDDLARLDMQLGTFNGRLARDRVVEQAAFLARGDREGYERAFGRL